MREERHSVLLVDGDGTWMKLVVQDRDRAIIAAGTAAPQGFAIRKEWQGTWEEAAEVIDSSGVTRLSPHDLAGSICRALGIHKASRRGTVSPCEQRPRLEVGRRAG